MDKHQLEQFRHLLDSTNPLFSWLIRRYIIRKLVKDSSPEVIPLLVASLYDNDLVVQSIADSALRSLIKPEAIDALCVLWTEAGTETLGKIISECGYVAQRPIEVRVLSALKADRPDLASDSPDAIASIIKSLESSDPAIQKSAWLALHSLKKPEVIDKFCEFWVEGRTEMLGEIIGECGYVARWPITVRVFSALKANRPDLAKSCPEVVLLKEIDQLNKQLESLLSTSEQWKQLTLNSLKKPSTLKAKRLGLTDDSPRVIDLLIKSLDSCDTTIQRSAWSALRLLEDPADIDTLCDLWVKERNEILGAIIAECGYVARWPNEVRVLSALKANRFVLAAEHKSCVSILSSAILDKDPDIAKGSEKILRSFDSPEMIDAVCELAITNPNSRIAAIVREQDYQPKSVSRRCLLYFLTDQLSRYLELDFEFKNLRAEYEVGDENLKRQIGDVVRQSRDSRLLGLFRVTRKSKQKQSLDLNDEEANIMIDVCNRNNQWQEIFRLLFHIPLSTVITALDTLGDSGWQPENVDERALLDELFELRTHIGTIPDKPEIILGAVIRSWIERGRIKGENIHQGEGGSPERKIVGLSALLASGKATAKDVEDALNHRHWLVRLVSLAFCNLAPQLLFSDIPKEVGEKNLWIDQLAPSMIDASMYQKCVLEYDLNQIESLRQVIEECGDKWPERKICGRIILALAHHYHRHTIELDEKLIVPIRETAIEVED